MQYDNLLSMYNLNNCLSTKNLVNMLIFATLDFVYNINKT